MHGKCSAGAVNTYTDIKRTVWCKEHGKVVRDEARGKWDNRVKFYPVDNGEPVITLSREVLFKKIILAIA